VTDFMVVPEHLGIVCHMVVRVLSHWWVKHPRSPQSGLPPRFSGGATYRPSHISIHTTRRGDDWLVIGDESSSKRMNFRPRIELVLIFGAFSN
jgi:hypothetical protein